MALLKKFEHSEDEFPNGLELFSILVFQLNRPDRQTCYHYNPSRDVLGNYYDLYKYH